jgi:DNA-binding NarL/FixJ family response regulator
MQFETEFYATSERSTVFVIEAEQVVRSALHYILRDRYRTVIFATLGDAIASAEVPDVVLLGVTNLRSEDDATAPGELFAGAKILLIADRHSDPRAQAALQRGAHGIVSKPISFESVRDAVGKAVARPVFADGPSRLIRVAFG